MIDVRLGDISAEIKRQAMAICDIDGPRLVHFRIHSATLFWMQIELPVCNAGGPVGLCLPLGYIELKSDDGVPLACVVPVYEENSSE